MEKNGWSDVGYNFLIRDGKIYTGRGWDVWPAHDGINDTIGVCVVGDYRTSSPNSADLAALRDFLAEARRRTGSSLVRGHRQSPGASTACPGDALQKWIDEKRYEGDVMRLSDRVILAEWVEDRWPGVGGDNGDGRRYLTVNTALSSTYGHARRGADDAAHVRKLLEGLGDDLARHLAEPIARAVAELAADRIGEAVARHLAERLSDDTDSQLAVM